MEKFTPLGKDGKTTTSRRLMLGLEATLALQVGKVNIEGSENIKKIPKDRKVIVVSTHITDLDFILTAKAVGGDLNLAMTDLSTHHSLKKEAPMYLALLAAGKDNFFPIDFEMDKKEENGKTYQGAKSFNPENFTPMAKAMEHGKAILIAGHNPSHNGMLGDAGYGAAYLAEIADAVILPVGVNVKTKDKNTGLYGSQVRTFFKKPDADVRIGAPFELPKIEGIEEFSKLLQKRKDIAIKGERLSNEDMDKFLQLSKMLRERSGEILKKLSFLIPEDKQNN